MFSFLAPFTTYIYIAVALVIVSMGATILLQRISLTSAHADLDRVTQQAAASAALAAKLQQDAQQIAKAQDQAQSTMQQARTQAATASQAIRRPNPLPQSPKAATQAVNQAQADLWQSIQDVAR